MQLAPYHDFDSKVPADLKTEVDQLKQDIISGKIKVTSPAQPSKSRFETGSRSRAASAHEIIAVGERDV